MNATIETSRHQDEKRKLPNGWRRVKLKDVCELNPRRPFIDREDSDPTSFIPMEAVDAVSGVVSNLRIRPYGEIKKGYTYFAEGDVLFAKITPCMQNGKHAIAVGLIDGIGFGTTEFHVLRPSKSIMSELIWSFVRQPCVLIEAIEHFTGAVGQQRLPQDYLANLEIPLPPLPEQWRLARVLQEQMAEVEKARTAAQVRLAAVKDLFAAFLGQVFPKPGQPLPGGWRWVKLGEVCALKNGINFTADQKGAGILTVDVLNMYSDTLHILMDDLYRVNISLSDEYLLQDGDILIVRSSVKREGVGWPSLFPLHEEPVTFCGFIIRARLISDQLSPQFMIHYLRQQHVRDLVIGKSGTGTITNINQSNLRQLMVPFPPICEQNRIVAVLHEQMAAVDKSRAAAEEELNSINALPAALLRQAFSGEI